MFYSMYFVAIGGGNLLIFVPSLIKYYAEQRNGNIFNQSSCIGRLCDHRI